ncbi:MAG: hypothetical protein BAJALOKI2v1_20029 [Promethearchaeota archaeon]|nr:MAG: hypothetical protein BAJALOKI2v1_20029 [Candidatus Lokiarchaeota archaeon]
MEMDIDGLKDVSLKFKNKLRIPISTLKICIDKDWKGFGNFVSDIIESPGGMKFKTQIDKVLIDTGNEADFVILSSYYFNTFKENIKHIKVDQKVLEDFQGNKRITDVSIDIFKFKIFKATFNSKIGFTRQTNVNALDIINIGIKAVKQFLNLIFLANSRNFYYCTNSE